MAHVFGSVENLEILQYLILQYIHLILKPFELGTERRSVKPTIEVCGGKKQAIRAKFKACDLQ